MNELKPCPFCGGKAMIWESEGIGYWFIKCRKCIVQMVNEDKKILVSAWNTRVGDSDG